MEVASRAQHVGGGWTRYFTNDNNPYYVHSTTGESSWESPNGTLPMPWVMLTTSEGVVYYNNPETGESKWPDDVAPLPSSIANALSDGSLSDLLCCGQDFLDACSSGNSDLMSRLLSVVDDILDLLMEENVSHEMMDALFKSLHGLLKFRTAALTNALAARSDFLDWSMNNICKGSGEAPDLSLAFLEETVARCSCAPSDRASPDDEEMVLRRNLLSAWAARGIVGDLISCLPCERASEAYSRLQTACAPPRPSNRPNSSEADFDVLADTWNPLFAEFSGAMTAAALLDLATGDDLEKAGSALEILIEALMGGEVHANKAPSPRPLPALPFAVCAALPRLLRVAEDDGPIRRASDGTMATTIGSSRIKLVCVLAALIRAQYVLANEALVRDGLPVLAAILDMFFDHPWHQALHHATLDLVRAVFTDGDDVRLQAAFFAPPLHLHARIVEANEENREWIQEPKRCRLGHMGHVRAMAEAMAEATARLPDLAARVREEAGPQSAFHTFVNYELDGIRQVEGSPWFSFAVPPRRTIPAEAWESDYDDDDEFRSDDSDGSGDDNRGGDDVDNGSDGVDPTGGSGHRHSGNGDGDGDGSNGCGDGSSVGDGGAEASVGADAPARADGRPLKKVAFSTPLIAGDGSAEELVASERGESLYVGGEEDGAVVREEAAGEAASAGAGASIGDSEKEVEENLKAEGGGPAANDGDFSSPPRRVARGAGGEGDDGSDEDEVDGEGLSSVPLVVNPACLISPERRKKAAAAEEEGRPVDLKVVVTKANGNTDDQNPLGEPGRFDKELSEIWGDGQLLPSPVQEVVQSTNSATAWWTKWSDGSVSCRRCGAKWGTACVTKFEDGAVRVSRNTTFTHAPPLKNVHCVCI